jgi:hypothetical protein
MSQKNEFMLLFRMAPSNEQPTAAQLEEMEQQWGAFFGKVGSQGAMVSTHHLGFTGKVITASQEALDGFHVADGQMVAGNLVIQANNMDEAIAIAKECPILYAGGSVEVRDVMPMN